MADSQRTRIQNAIIALVTAGTFHPVTYTAGVASIDDSESIAPASVLVNEINASFESDKSMGLKLSRKRRGWQFELHLSWNQEVDLSKFEESITEEVPRLAPTSTFGPIFLELDRAKYEHPVQQQGPNGTKATMIFNANEGAHY